PVDRLCGGHPMAGREIRGPAAALGRLFLDRPWVLCPGPRTAPDAVADVAWLAARCGAVPVLMSPEEHDRAVALVSHLPQVAASALAARLEGAGDEALRLAGPGVQDTTRVAASDSALWREVLTRNAAEVGPLVQALAADLHALGDALTALADRPEDETAARAVVDLLERGARGRSRLPLKSRSGPHRLDRVVVDVPDEPGQLAAALQAAAAAGVNVEDLRVEHLPGRPRGLLELLVDAGEAAQAREALAAAGFDVVGG
ncbi:MAG TPA: prephenate dehydrogenase/arogenate dehydrogenase family protein, partial [Mycobacteriales bacterium]|nr:prephenate dehydrogenase/arogenate dehydrogenase family protein [Mycobacteriales bacterium]